MPNVDIAINYATVADVQTGNATAPAINPATLKSALQSGSSLYDLNLNGAVLNGNANVTNRINAGGLTTSTSTITGLNIAIGNTATIGAAGTLTTSSNISATGNIVFGNTGSNIIGTNSIGNRTISTLTPTGGSHGDIWYQI